MTFNFKYCQEYARLIPGVLTDSRQNIPAILNKDGWAIKTYTDAQVATIVPGVLCYEIRSLDGNLAGYFTLQINNGVGSLISTQLRPAFVSFLPGISQQIATFMSGNQYNFDTI